MLGTIRDAYQRGYIVELYFVATVDPAINIGRIAERVARGEHHIPDDVVRRRYPRSIEHAAEIAAFAHFVGIIDNSGTEPETCVRLDDGELAVTFVPKWATRIARVLEERVMREREHGRSP
jgi:predicted ABC-type ATPase